MARRGGKSKAYIIGGLIVAVAIIAYFVLGDGMTTPDDDTPAVTSESETQTGGAAPDGEAAPSDDAPAAGD